MARALVVEDDSQNLAALTALVEREGFEVVRAESLARARQALKEGAVDLILADLRLPDGNALELIERITDTTRTEIVFITGDASVDSAVTAFRNGAVDYLTKPLDVHRLRRILQSTARTARLREQVDTLREELRELGRFGRLIGSSQAMQAVYDQILRVAPTDASVFVMGETGTGKELVAATIHQLSGRADGPYIPINCGAMSPSLIESELFGHERGSFTGANRRHQGVFERANGGTLFLDEITEMPGELQVKLLRVLETGQVSRIGGEDALEVDVRIVAATNRDPEEAAEKGILRPDLLYRLLVFPIALPPLRERPGDVQLLASYFLEQRNREQEGSKRLSEEALQRLNAYDWPGNVRELQNAIERAFILAEDRITPECLPIRPRAPSRAPSAADRLDIQVGMTTKQAEKTLVLATLEHCGGDKQEAARRLGISLKTLYNRLHEYGAR